MGQADLTGTVKGQAIEFVVSATVQGTPIELNTPARWTPGIR